MNEKYVHTQNMYTEMKLRVSTSPENRGGDITQMYKRQLMGWGEKLVPWTIICPRLIKLIQQKQTIKCC